jgi:beta-galactosidase
MNWHYLRYCVGFPPELWYEIADEEGIMIQDEFPIWTADPKREQGMQAPQLATEFAEWMRERWNHPSVVIWDACNESLEPQTGQALRTVRGLDLSDRPWDDGWNAPDRPGDLREWHPYALHVEYYNWGHNTNQFRRSVPEAGLLVSALAPKSIGNPNPEGQPLSSNPRMINEYGWLWVTREGKPTTLTAYLYRLLLGTNAALPGSRSQCAKPLPRMIIRHDWRFFHAIGVRIFLTSHQTDQQADFFL